MLVHASLSACKEPQYALDDEVRHKPTHAACSNCVVNISSLEEICDQAIDRQPTLELFAKDFEAREGFRKRQKAGSEAHRDRFSISLYCLVGDICSCQLRVIAIVALYIPMPVSPQPMTSTSCPVS